MLLPNLSGVAAGCAEEGPQGFIPSPCSCWDLHPPQCAMSCDPSMSSFSPQFQHSSQEIQRGMGAGWTAGHSHCIQQRSRALLVGFWLCPWGKALLLAVQALFHAGFIPDPQESKAAASGIPVPHPAGASHSL